MQGEAYRLVDVRQWGQGGFPAELSSRKPAAQKCFAAEGDIPRHY